MDDKPTIEYHPFGTITLNFDEVAVKLRRCRLGDLQFAKDLLEELRLEAKPLTDKLIADLNELRDENAEQAPEGDAREAFQRLGVILEALSDIRQDVFYRWMAAIIERMGDHPAPAKEDWPLELFHAYPITVDDPMSGRIIATSEILNHWQSRPLASGRTSPNGTIREAATSTPLPPDPSYPPAPLPQ